jgi:glycosyltransferase involved in cell wall biosynthesis
MPLNLFPPEKSTSKISSSSMVRIGLYANKKWWEMATSADCSKLHVLHILTLNGRNGEYGGPVRVARELCSELNTRGHETRIFSGALEGAEPEPKPGLIENYVLVRPLSSNYSISSLWSWKLFPLLAKSIKESDVVHIHFARELIPFLAAIISILQRKPFVTQTHGMIIGDNRISTRIVDWIFTRPLATRSYANFVLTSEELSEIEKLRINTPLRILPNGISIGAEDYSDVGLRNRFAFCSRLEKRKGVEKFIQLADHFKNDGITFEIYGPDGGDLDYVRKKIDSSNLGEVITYNGSLPAHQVQEVLSQVDLLILPSKNEPFPMVILEAMAVGTSVLVMPSCGIASQLKQFRSWFVSRSEDIDGLIESVETYISSIHLNERAAIQDFCKENFSIENVCSQLEKAYLESLNGDGK